MHTATIVTTVQLIDAMSPALGMIQNAQALVAQGFLKIRNAADRFKRSLTVSALHWNGLRSKRICPPPNRRMNV